MIARAGILALSLLPSGALASEVTDQVLFLALSNIDKAKCDADVLCAPATDAELQTPPLSEAQVQEAMNVATWSAFASACELDYEARIFGPYMDGLRQEGVYSARQMALVGIIHGITLGMLETRPDIACTDDVKQKLGVAPD